MKTEANTHEQVVTRVLEVAKGKFPEADLSRLKYAAEVWAGVRGAKGHPGQVAKGFFMPGLPNEPWVDPKRFPFADVLEDRYVAIKKECQALVDGTLAPPPYGLEDRATGDDPPRPGNPEQWREWRLFRAGLLDEERATHFASTVGAIREILKHTPFVMNATFLIMKPGGVLAPHSDFNNIFVNIWLPLMTPRSCFLTVAGIQRKPRAGKLLAFNHSFIHSAGNPGPTDRIVLSLSVLHPDLSDSERCAIAHAAPLFNGFALRASAPTDVEN
jgi:hypothetical protein